jgi:hypothetical protein
MDESQPPLDSSEINTELLFLLSVSSPNWERVQYLYNLLLESDFHLVPPQLIQKLGVHYIQSMVREEVPASEALSTCLLSHQAYGYPLPPMLAETLDKWNKTQPTYHSPFLRPVAWSTSALMQIDSAASMDSPVIHVWVYNDEKNIPVEVIICGRGIGWIREQIDNLVLSTALRLSAKSADVLLEGLTCLRLTPEEIEQSAAVREKQTFIPAEVFLLGGKIQSRSTLREDVSPAEAMNELVGELVQLEAKTGLVEVIKRSYVRRSEYQLSINTKSREYRQEGVTLWQHTATEAERIIIPHPIPSLNINLPFSLVDSPDFKILHSLYRNDLVRAAAADALRRLSFYTSNLTDHTTALKTYLDPDRRNSLPETVQLDIQIDYETGLSYRLKDPDEKSRDEYYGRHVPSLILMDITWIRKIKKLIHILSTAIAKPDSNLNRLTIARLFDAALRDIPISSTPEVAQAFETWKKKVQPLLWHLWEKTLMRNGLEQKFLASRQVFFMLDIVYEEKLMMIRPFFLADTKTSLFIFDARYPVPIVQSLYDRLTEVDYQPQTDKARQSLADWKAQAIAGKTKDAQESLQAALALDPEVTLREIVNAYQKPFVPQSAFEKDATTTNKKVFPILAQNLGVRLWSRNGFQSGYAILEKALTEIQKESLDSELHNLVDIPLALAWLKAVIHFGRDVPEHLKRLRHNSANETEREIQKYLHIAMQLDANHVTRCLDKKDLLVSRALKELRSLSHLNATELSMFNILRALAFVQAAQDIALGVEELDVSGESPRSIYAKVAPAVDAVWSNQYIQDVSDQMDDLINMLLGFEVV